MANGIPETPPGNMPDQEPWNCEVDGHEFEKEGEYDPDTGSYPCNRCTYCGAEIAWDGDDDFDPDEEYERDQ